MNPQSDKATENSRFDIGGCVSQKYKHDCWRNIAISQVKMSTAPVPHVGPKTDNPKLRKSGNWIALVVCGRETLGSSEVGFWQVDDAANRLRADHRQTFPNHNQGLRP